jgi:DNA-directed RNA polymerase specialized sigma24 family protein
MQGTERIPLAETRQVTIAGVSEVFAAESPIRACLARGDSQAASSMCRPLYAEVVGRYCMAALGNLTLAKQAALDVWGRLERELQTADASRTIRSLILGLARRRCAYLLETNQLPNQASVPNFGTAGTEQPVAEKHSPPETARRLLLQLRPSDREILILRYVSKLTYSEIGYLWGIGESDARLKVSQAVAHATAHSRGEESRHG